MNFTPHEFSPVSLKQVTISSDRSVSTSFEVLELCLTFLESGTATGPSFLFSGRVGIANRGSPSNPGAIQAPLSERSHQHLPYLFRGDIPIASGYCNTHATSEIRHAECLKVLSFKTPLRQCIDNNAASPWQERSMQFSGGGSQSSLSRRRNLTPHIYKYITGFTRGYVGLSRTRLRRDNNFLLPLFHAVDAHFGSI